MEKNQKSKFHIKPYKIDYADDEEFDELNYSLVWIKHSGFYIHVIHYWLWFRCLFEYTCKKSEERGKKAHAIEKSQVFL